MERTLTTFWWKAERLLEELGPVVRLEGLSPELRRGLDFSLRSWVAGITALYIAFKLQLDEPYWAAAAVWIVAQPTPGMALSKAFYRVLGTIIGATVGVFLIAMFSQTPELFVLALGLWIGVCTVGANLLRNFRSYGAVLAGFTASVVSLAAVADPNQVFTIAVARTTSNVLGICCAAFFAGILARGESARQVLMRLKGAVGDAARRASFPLARRPREESFTVGRHLITEVMALDTEIDYAAAESGGFRIRAPRARGIITELFGVISSARAMESLEERRPGPYGASLEEVRGEVLEFLADVPEAVAREDWAKLEGGFARGRELLRHLTPEQAGPLSEAEVAERYYIDRLDDLLCQLRDATEQVASLTRPWQAEPPPPRLDFHRDHFAAAINGVRAFAAVVAAGAFWIESGWPSGASMLIIVGITASLFSTLPHPGQLALRFFFGVAVAVTAAFICSFFMIKYVTGWFELGGLCIGVFMIPAGVGLLFEKTRAFASAFSLIFITTLRPSNPMNFDVIFFLNNSLATLVGVAIGAVAYGLIVPYDPRLARRYVMHRIRRGLAVISRRQPTPPFSIWQSRMIDRINRLYLTSTAPVVQKDASMKVGLGALDAGNELLRLRHLMQAGRIERRAQLAAEVVLEKFGSFQTRPFEAVDALRAMAEEIRELPAPDDAAARLALSRLRGSVEEMNFFFAEYAGELSS